MDDGEMSRASKGRMTELFANNRRVFDTLKRKVTPYAWDKEVTPGVLAVGTPGHSIGHTSYLVNSGNKTIFVQSDVCNNVAVFAPYPDWHGFFDQDPPKAAATRKASTTCWSPRSFRCRAITSRSRRWPGSRSRAAAIASTRCRRFRASHLVTWR